MSLELTKQRLQSAKDRVDKLIDNNLVIWATETILLPAQNDITNSISPKAAQGLSLEKTGFKKVDLVWDLTDDKGAPIHYYLEFGTGPHKIEAKGKIFGGADSLHWKGPTGKDVFAKIVNHPGSTKHKGLIQTIKDERLPALKERIISETHHNLEISSL